jgi:flagellar FliJ protein
MTRSERLAPVSQVAEKRERDAVKVMSDCQRAVDEHEKRLNELYEYRDEYSKRMQAAGRQGIDPSKLNDYNTFIRKLDDAIAFQKKEIETSKRIYEAKKSEWMALRTRSQALDKVVDKYKKEEQQVKDRREQKESDDRAQYASKKNSEKQ